MEQIKKLKGEIKRLRTDLLMKGSSRKKVEDSDESDLDEEETAALRMLSSDQRKNLAMIEKEGAGKAYLKKWIRD